MKVVAKRLPQFQNAKRKKASGKSVNSLCLQGLADRRIDFPRALRRQAGCNGPTALPGAFDDGGLYKSMVLKMNGDSYRLNQSKRRARGASSDPSPDNPTNA